MPHAGEPADDTLVDIKIKQIIITPWKMSYDSDHAVLTDRTDDWKRGTTTYHSKDPHEWSCKPPHRFPISQTKNTKLKITVVFYVSRKSTETVSGKVVGDGGTFYLQFEGSGSFAPGQTVEVTMTATRALPDQCLYLANQAIAWRVEGGGEIYPAGSSGPSSIYATLDKPKDETDEDGPTHRRMNAAVRLVETVRSNEPHEIVENLMSRFPGYTLQQNKTVPDEYNHPEYLNTPFGAWPIYENMRATGECQAIVRFVRNVIHQVGCPGKAEAIVVYADAFSGNAMESPFGHAGMSSFGWFPYKGKMVYATLADQVVAEGRSYPPSHTPLPGGGGSPGFNRYEACLKFTHGHTKYYAGGVQHGIFNSKDEVILAFNALVWASPDPSRPKWTYIDRIVRRYR
jgi:hypothetical protein